MQISNIKTLVQYLDGMKSFYGWKSEDWNMIEANLQHLVQRYEDKRLYLGIVGEFDAGKSTFINALLGFDILKEDILPGTTCASTLICYGENFEVEIFCNNTKKVIRYTETFGMLKKFGCFLKKTLGMKEHLNRQLDEAKMFIHKYTADEEFSKSVSQVFIYLPCKLPIFENDVVIVDTPGINADNPRHQEVTEETVRDLCDLAIVLTPAPSPCSRTLLAFIHEYLKSFHKYCICLASQVDRLRKPERLRQMKYIEERFHSEEIFFSKIYPISAYYTSHPEETSDKDEAQDFRDDFAKTKTLICEDLKNNKDIILSHKVHLLLQHIILSMLTPMLKSTQDEVAQRYEELRKNQLSDFDSFLQSEKNYIVSEFSKQAVKKYEIDDITGNAREQFVSQLYTKISSVTSKGQLKDLMEQASLMLHMQSIQEGYVQQEILKIQERLSLAARELFEQFKDEFNNEFRNLGRYSESSIASINVITPVFSVNLDDNLNVVSSSIASNSWAKIGGATAGGVIGSLVIPIPVLGTIIGAGIGGFLGSLFGKSLEEYQKDAKDLVDKVAKQWSMALGDQIFSNVIQSYYQTVSEYLNDAIDNFTQFKPEVEKIISEEKVQQDRLQCVIKQAEKDLSVFRSMSENPAFLFQPNSGIEV